MNINFLLGFSRSGTSILMSYLRGNKKIETGYEEPNHLWRLMSHLKWEEEYEDYLNVKPGMLQDITDKAIRNFTETFYNGLTDATGRSTVILKHPWLVPYVFDLDRIFPNAKFLFLWRHPYNVIASTLDFAKKDNIANKMFGVKLGRIIKLYKKHVDKLFEINKKYSTEKILNVRYEDFIKTPKQELKKIFDFFGVVSTKELNDIIAVKSQVKTARVLETLELVKPKEKFLKLNKKQQALIISNLESYANRLGYDNKRKLMGV